MKMSEEDFNNKLDEYVKESYNKAPHKPNGMYGHMAFRAVKKREFVEKLRAEGYEIE